MVARWSAQATADYLVQNTNNTEDFSPETLAVETVQRAIQHAPAIAEGSEEAARLMLWRLSDMVFNDEVKQRLVEVLQLLQVIPRSQENTRTPSALKALVRESRARALSEIEALLDEALQHLSSVRDEICILLEKQQLDPEVDVDQSTSFDEVDAALLEDAQGREAEYAEVCAHLEEQKLSHSKGGRVRAEDVARLVAAQAVDAEAASAFIRCALENASGIADGDDAAASQLMGFVEVEQEAESPVETPREVPTAEPIAAHVEVKVQEKDDLSTELSNRLVSAFRRVFKTMSLQVSDLEQTCSKPERLAREFAAKLASIVAHSPQSESGGREQDEEPEPVRNQHSPSRNCRVV